MIRIERFGKEDFSRLKSWIETEEALIQFSGPIFSFPLTEQQLEVYISDPRRHAFKVINAENKRVIGHAEVYLMEDNSAKLCRILIADVQSRGKGMGQKLVSELLKFSFIHLQASRAMLNVYDWNVPAIKCYEKAGFTIVQGRTKSTSFKGKTWNAIHMTINKPTWERIVTGSTLKRNEM